MSDIFSNPLFGIVLSIFAYAIGVFLNKKTKSPLVNPLLVAMALIIIILQVFNIPYEDYNAGGKIITMMIAPATAALGYSIYRQIVTLKKYFIPIFAGCFMGSLASLGSVFLLCKLFGIEEAITSSLMPKSVTTAIAMEISEQLGGIPAITVPFVIITGVLGAVLSPLLIKLFRIDHEVAQGVAIGSSSHAVGTSKALELGQIQGAMSGISIGVSGIITVLLALFL